MTGWLGASRWRGHLMTLRLLPEVGLFLSVIAAAGILLGSAVPPLLIAYAGILTSAAHESLVGSSPGIGVDLIKVLLVVSALFVALEFGRFLARASARLVGQRLDHVLSDRLMKAMLHPTHISHVEDPRTANDLAKSRGLLGGHTPGAAVPLIAAKWTARLQGIGAALLLGRSFPWLAISATAVYLGTLGFWQRHYAQLTSWAMERSPDLRRGDYHRDLAATPPAAKELRVFGLSEWVVERFHEHWLEGMTSVWKKWRAHSPRVAAAIALPSIVSLAGFTLIGISGLNGEVSVGEAVTSALGLLMMRELGAVPVSDRAIAIGTGLVPIALELEGRLINQHLAPAEIGGQVVPREHIGFEGVTFQYPGSSQVVLDGLDLRIEVGRSLAIVGENGAGKTTIIKLLARLYDPTEGVIAVDDVDLKSLEVNKWRTQTSAIFQNFTRYHLSALDNVAFGAPHLSQEQQSLERAASRAGALQIIEALPARWETPLSRQRSGGVDLSGGEWQRVALARALLGTESGASILILDEPTANLDVRGEAELYDRFLELTRGLTTILVSHRFSTVRKADRIVVLHHGRIVEDGTHGELLAADGRYAQMFRMQASAFQPDERRVDQ